MSFAILPVPLTGDWRPLLCRDSFRGLDGDHQSLGLIRLTRARDCFEVHGIEASIAVLAKTMFGRPALGGGSSIPGSVVVEFLGNVSQGEER